MDNKCFNGNLLCVPGMQYKECVKYTHTHTCTHAHIPNVCARLRSRRKKNMYKIVFCQLNLGIEYAFCKYFCLIKIETTY